MVLFFIGWQHTTTTHDMLPNWTDMSKCLYGMVKIKLVHL